MRSLPPEIQDFLDSAIASLGDRTMLNMNAALNQFTTWLERENRMNDGVCGYGKWMHGVTLEEVRNDLKWSDFERPEDEEIRLAVIRDYLQRAFDGDQEILGAEYSSHVALAVRSRAGQQRILGFFYSGDDAPKPFNWHGLFNGLASYRRWLLEAAALLTSVRQFDNMSRKQQLSLWPPSAPTS